jgi:UDP-N-acetylglucosamine diphosphorylase / glucose-1-phosphate thymidylyltransferase / UDP-N-acetylgalactosamine diphosphorylase / glucosamine-1-phosphate N-acetyltransferase / galactosamine-1-phosphate N-acetyltransferase
MKVVMPMAGRGSRYANQGFTEPKPFINILGRPIFSWAIQSLKGVEFEELIVILLKDHASYVKKFKDHFPRGTRYVMIDEVTDGQLCTVLEAKEILEEGTVTDLLVISSDTLVISNMGEDIRKRTECEGLISVANLPGDQWSFARTNDEGKVLAVSEKVRISENASTGLYYFRNTANFLELAGEMVRDQEKTRGEFYVMPLYQKYIDRGYYIGVSNAWEMWDLGTPEASKAFQESGVNQRLG